ncbi:MAG: hypothetical protein JWP18_168 [Solirubrobacterales bacterium]|nr:hypothetical protein [Solirubrobacterales bacterium]
MVPGNYKGDPMPANDTNTGVAAVTEGLPAMTMYPARVTELPNPAMAPPAIRIRPVPEPEPAAAPGDPGDDSPGPADRYAPHAEPRPGLLSST